MVGCSNCFNGCGPTTPDKCVKYTGVDIPSLGIATGDSLLHVEDVILNYIQTLKNGTGVLPVIAPEIICAYLDTFIPNTPDLDVNQYLSSLIEAICDLNDRLGVVETDLQLLNADYIIDCLEGVTPSSDTHEVLQAAINKICEIDAAIETLGAELTANYVLISEIDNYIASYLASLPTSSAYRDKMIPYVAVPYFGPTVGFFDLTGAGLGNFDQIYLCNGQNLTPDLRGRALVGATTMGSTPFNSAVDPALPGNPTYALNTTAGANQAVLTNPSQIPVHDHPVTLTINDPGHIHNYTVNGPHINGVNCDGGCNGVNDNTSMQNTSSSFTGLKGNGNGPNPNVIVTVGSTGQTPSSGHPNIQPVHAANYIIYIPTP